MFEPARRALFASLVLLALLPLPSAAATLRVPAQFPTIQAALDAASAGDTVRVARGVFTEQLVVTRDVTIVGAAAGLTIVRAPDTLATGATDERSIVEIGEGVAASISRLSIRGPGAGTCEDGALTHGILLLPGSHLDLSFAEVTHIHDTPLAACFRSGNGIFGFEASARIRFSAISQYQSAGVVLVGGTAEIEYDVVTGPGATPATAAEGIMLIGGTTGTVSNNVVSGNGCGSPDLGCGPDFFGQFQVFGISAEAGTEISHNLVFDNQVGIYLAVGGAPEKNILIGNDVGLALQDGDFTSRGDLILGGRVGAAVIAADADATARFERTRILGQEEAQFQKFERGGFTATVVRRR